MIHFITGDIFDTPADGRVNTVNCVGVMGKGVALAFRARYPDLFTEYRKVCSDKLLKPGGVWIWRIPALTVFNVATKNHWNKPSRYEWVAQGLLNLRRAIRSSDCRRVVLPPPGCGNGGLDYDKVKRMIIKCFDGLDRSIYVVQGGSPG